MLQQCDGCNIVNTATCAQPLGCDYGDSTCEDKCISSLANIDNAYVSLPRCTGTQTTSCPQIPGKNVLDYNSCQYGCDSNTGLCRTKPATKPYCENTEVCGSCTASGCIQEVHCWPSFADSACNFLQSGASPRCDPLYGYTSSTLVVEICGAVGCHATSRWCVSDPTNVCPPASMPDRTQKWMDTCGFIDCKDPSVELCDTGVPPPTPPPGVTVPTCTINSISLAPAQPVIMSPVTITATVTTTVSSVDYVAFYVRNADGDVVANGSGQDSDGTNGYTFSYTPPDASPFTVTATGVFSETGTVPCTRTTGTTTPVPPTTTVNIRTYQVGVGVCNNPVALGGVPVELTRMDTDPEQVRSGTTNGSGLYSWPSVIGGNTTNYRLRATPPNYVYQACTNGTNPRDFNVPYSPAGSYSHDFYFTLMADPWFQIYHGDVGAAGGSISSLVSGDNNTFLAQLVANSSGVAMANGAVAANPVGPAGRLWQADGVNFSQVDYWYGYFMASFDQVFTQQDIEELSQDSFDDDIWDTHSEEVDSRVLWVSGDLAVNHDIDVPPGKWTIFVPGNLEIDAPGIVTEQGEYIAFVVRGNINFTDRTRQIQGVYVADGELTVENTTMDFGTGRQFEGQGIFIGQGGVTLQRDLNGSTLPDDDLANNTAAAQVFTYRPDFVINAPLGFLRSSVMWQEVAPMGGIVAAPLPPPPNPTCVEAGHKCVPSTQTCTPSTIFSGNPCTLETDKCVEASAACINPPKTCIEAGYKCVSQDLVCSPVTTYTNSCSAGQKCVPLAATCSQLTIPPTCQESGSCTRNSDCCSNQCQLGWCAQLF